MKYGLLDILTGTPLWVWGVFAYLLVMGIMSSQKRVVSIYRLAIMPSIFVIWSLASMYSKYGYTWQNILLWLIAYVTGILAGYLLSKREKIEVNLKEKMVLLAGSYIPLILSISFFVIKYIIGVAYALQPAFKMNPLFFGVDIISSGIISGISGGRLIALAKKYIRPERT